MTATICLVEDEVLLREMTQADLEDLGFDVLSVSTCEEAWQIMSAGRTFACLVTDIRTPGAIDGWELARRTRERSPDTPVIYVSGYPGGEPQLVAGAIFLPKPYLHHELSGALERIGLAPPHASTAPRR